eukprot:815674-Rhodomonas_salina.1
MAFPTKSASYLALEQSMHGANISPPWNRFMTACQKLLDDLTSTAGVSTANLLDDSALDEAGGHGGRDAKVGAQNRLGRMQMQQSKRRDRDEMMGSVCFVSSALAAPSPPLRNTLLSQSRHVPELPRDASGPPTLQRNDSTASYRQTAIEEDHPLLCTVEDDDAEERESARAALTGPRGKQSAPDLDGGRYNTASSSNGLPSAGEGGLTRGQVWQILLAMCGAEKGRCGCAVAVCACPPLCPDVGSGTMH